MVLGKESWSDVANRVKVCQVTQTTRGETMLRRILGFGMFHSILKIDVGINVSWSRRGEGTGRRAATIGLRRERWGKRIRRGRETSGVLLDWKGLGRHCSETLLPSPEVVSRLGDID